MQIIPPGTKIIARSSETHMHTLNLSCIWRWGGGDLFLNCAKNLLLRVFSPDSLDLGVLFSLWGDDRLKAPSALMSFETGYGFRELHPWAFRLNFHQEWQMLHQGEEGFWTMPSGKVASQVKFFMTADHGLSVRQFVCEGEVEGSEKEGHSLWRLCVLISI